MASRWLPLRSDCDARYDEMQPGDGSQRSCERCATPVHDLSARTVEEARVFRRENPDACVRYLHDGDGRLVHTDRPPSIIPPSWLVRAQRAALIAATLASPLLIEACGPCARDACGCITEGQEPIQDPKDCPGGDTGSASGAGGGGGAGAGLDGGDGDAEAGG